MNVLCISTNLIFVIAFLFLTISASAKQFDDAFRLIEGKRFLVDGVNCHSTSMQASGLLDYPSHVTSEELDFILKTQCAEVEDPSRGVIGLVGRGTMGEHSFFYLNRTDIFQKRSLERESAYTVRRGLGKRGGHTYFRCRPRAHSCGDEKLLNIIERVRSNGLDLGYFAVGRRPLRIRETVFQETKKLKQELLDLSVSKECSWVRKSTYWRADSINAMAKHIRGANLYLQTLPNGSKM